MVSEQAAESSITMLIGRARPKRSTMSPETGCGSAPIASTAEAASAPRWVASARPVPVAIRLAVKKGATQRRMPISSKVWAT
jgi:hypothetical protein